MDWLRWRCSLSSGDMERLEDDEGCCAGRAMVTGKEGRGRLAMSVSMGCWGAMLGTRRKGRLGARIAGVLDLVVEEEESS